MTTFVVQYVLDQFCHTVDYISDLLILFEYLSIHVYLFYIVYFICLFEYLFHLQPKGWIAEHQ